MYARGFWLHRACTAEQDSREWHSSYVCVLNLVLWNEDDDLVATIFSCSVHRSRKLLCAPALFGEYWRDENQQFDCRPSQSDLQRMWSAFISCLHHRQALRSAQACSWRGHPCIYFGKPGNSATGKVRD